MKPACTESLHLCVNTHQIFPSQRCGWLFPTLAAFISPKPSPVHRYTTAQDLPVGLWQTPRRSFHEPWHPGEELPVCRAVVLPTLERKGTNVNLPTGYRRRKIDCLVSRSDGILPPGNHAHIRRRDGNRHQQAENKVGNSFFFFF